MNNPAAEKRVIFMGRKPYASEALEFLVAQNFDVVCVVATKDKNFHWEPKLAETAERLNLPVVSDIDIYKILEGKAEDSLGLILKPVDLVISYLFWKKIKSPLIKLGKIGCINFHPAPLPELRGLGGYNAAILDGMEYYGVTAHFVDESFDTGDIIKVTRFGIDPEKETAFSLEQRSQRIMFELFKELTLKISKGETLPMIRQPEGRYINRSEFQDLRRIQPEDTPEMIDKKIRAFWYPPYGGAFIDVNGKEYTLCNEAILENIGNYYHKKDSK